MEYEIDLGNNKNEPRQGSLIPLLMKDLSFWLLLVSNIYVIYLARVHNWDFVTIIWIYWAQSVIIGFFNFIRILKLKNFTTQGFTINGSQPPPTPTTKRFTAFFFLLHYGFFHLVYFVFIIGFSAQAKLPMASIFYTILPVIGIFFINHFISFMVNSPKETGDSNIGKIMFMPYIRIIPMHIIIIFGSFFGQGALFIFLIMKTGADIVMHVYEHYFMRMRQAGNSI
jgi:hypothetical protein